MPALLQRDFGGGQVSRFGAENVPENAYYYGENLELRDGGVRTRRGSFVLSQMLGTGEIQGAGVFRDDSRAETWELLLYVRNGTVYAHRLPELHYPLTLPAGVDLTDKSVRFVQGLSYIYLFLGDSNTPLRWSGDLDDPVEVVTAPAGLSIMPNSDRAIFAYNRWWVVTEGNTINASDLLSDGFDLLTNSFSVERNDGQRVVAMFPSGDGGMLILRDRSVALLTNANAFTTAADLSMVWLDHEFGCISPDSVVRVGSDILWLSRQGVVSASETNELNVRRALLPRSVSIPDWIARVNWATASTAKALWFDNYYLLAVPLDAELTPSAFIPYDFVADCWPGGWTGVGAQYLMTMRQGGRQELIGVDSAGVVLKLLTGRLHDYEWHGKQDLVFGHADAGASIALGVGDDTIITDAGDAIVLSDGAYLEAS